MFPKEEIYKQMTWTYINVTVSVPNVAASVRYRRGRHEYAATSVYDRQVHDGSEEKQHHILKSR